MARDGQSFDTVAIEGLAGPSPVVFLCEHAAHFIPPQYHDLGLRGTALTSHIAWDIGALALAQRLAGAFGAPLVAGRVSRLIYDCNRPPEAPDAIPARSEVFDIPGNADLTPQARQARQTDVYDPFCAAVDRAMLAARPAALVTVHSFTPVYNGQPRPVQIGILHDSDRRLADALLAQDWGNVDVQRNQPYGPGDGVTHSLKLHAQSRGRANVMIEVRSDLIDHPEGLAAMAALLDRNLHAALTRCGVVMEGAR
ncbi:N-formylglutamate amidohydrolase [Actibacterium sp. D379-3]